MTGSVQGSMLRTFFERNNDETAGRCGFVLVFRLGVRAGGFGVE